MDEATEREELKSVVTDPSWVNEELRKIHGGGDAALGQGEAIDEDEVNMVAEADVDEDDDP